MIGRALAIWLVLLVAAITNGALRESLLTPRFGAPTAHVLSTILLCLAIVALATATIGWMVGTAASESGVAHASIDRIVAPAGSGRAGAVATGTLVAIGLLWLVLVLAFEFGFGHFVGGKTWPELLGEYNVMRGRVWIAVPIVTVLAPYLAARVRGLV